jgi:hypothetical protein
MRLSSSLTKEPEKDWKAGRSFYLMQKQKYPEIIGFGFGKVSETVALQGADMIALETNQFGREWIKDRDNPAANPHFSDFRYRDLSTGFIVDREHIEEIIARVRSISSTTSD